MAAGVFSEVDFGEDELVFKDPILVGAQHSSNKVCEICHLFFSNVFIFWFDVFMCYGRLIVWCVAFASSSLAR